MLELIYTVEVRKTKGGVVYVKYIGSCKMAWTILNNEGEVNKCKVSYKLD